MHLCMIRFVDNTNANGGDHQGFEEDMENIKYKVENKRGGMIVTHHTMWMHQLESPSHIRTRSCVAY